MAVDTLPPGYVLNTPQQSSGSLPPGYVVNPPPKTGAFDYWVTNPLKAAGQSYLNDAKDIGTVIAHPIDALAGIGNAVTHPVDTVVSTVKGVPDMVMNHPIQTGLAMAPFAEGAVSGITNATKAVGDTGVKTGRYFNRIKSTFNPQAIKNLNVSLPARISNLEGNARSLAQNDIQPLQEDIGNIQKSTTQNLQNISYQSKDLTTATQGAIQESRRILKQNVNQLKSNLQDVAENGAVEFQKKLPDFFEANSEAYGSARDAAIAKMAANGDGITYQQVAEAIAKTKQDIESALIPSDAPALKIINQLEEKYSPKTIGEQSGILDANGNPIAKELPNNANDFVDSNQLIQDLRNVKSTLSAGAKAGRTGFNQEDLAVGYLDHNLGDFIKAKVPGFAQLQSEYTPVIRAMNQAHKIFKPNQGEFNTLNATNFLKKAGMGKLESGQEKLLGTLESGSKFSPGVGNISTPVKQVGSKLQQTVSEGQAKIEALQNNLRANLVKLETQKRNLVGSSQSDITQKQALIKTRTDALNKRLSDLEIKRQKIVRLSANKGVAAKLKSAIVGKTVEKIPGGNILNKIQ